MGGNGTNINVGNVTGNSGPVAIGNNISITVTNVSELLRSFLPVTPDLIDDKRRQIRHLWSMGVPEWPYFDRDWRKAEDVQRKLYYDLFTRITNPPNPDH